MPARRPARIPAVPTRRPGPTRLGRRSAGLTPVAGPILAATPCRPDPTPARRPVRPASGPAPTPAAARFAKWTGAAARPAYCARTAAATRSYSSGVSGCAWPTANGSSAAATRDEGVRRRAACAPEAGTESRGRRDIPAGKRPLQLRVAHAGCVQRFAGRYAEGADL